MTQSSLSINRLISTDVSLSPQSAQGQNLQSFLILGNSKGSSSYIIDPTSTRCKLYGSLAEVGVDFDPTFPEYLAAKEWFAQSPQPTSLWIGSYSSSNTPAVYSVVSDNSFDDLLSSFTAITDANFNVLTKGAVPVEAYVRNLNLSTCESISDVVTALTNACNTAVSPYHPFVFSYDAVKNTISLYSSDLTSPIDYLDLPKEYFGFNATISNSAYGGTTTNILKIGTSVEDNTSLTLDTS